MSKVPEKLRYTEDHEWVLVTGGVATIGITDHAQDALGDIVYLGDFPDAGDKVEQGDTIGVVESVKATSDIFSPVSGEVLEVNEDLEENPELVNSDPYEAGWILKIKLSAPDELDDLLDAEAYEALSED